MLVDLYATSLCSLSNLTKMRELLIKLNKTSADAYNASATEFLNATRLARQAKDDLNDITRRLS